MPKTQLFETDLHMEEDTDDEEMDVKDLIKPGMIFRMKYTQTKNCISEGRSIQVIVVSIRTIIHGCCDSGVHVLGCVLKTDIPIFICARRAELGREIILESNERPAGNKLKIASGYVENFLDECHDKWKYAST